jgi:hypothetical protein
VNTVTKYLAGKPVDVVGGQRVILERNGGATGSCGQRAPLGQRVPRATEVRQHNGIAFGRRPRGRRRL